MMLSALRCLKIGFYPLSGLKPAKFRYLRNFYSKVFVPFVHMNISGGPCSSMYNDTCTKENKNHWFMNFVIYPLVIEFETPITNSYLLVDICKTSENGFTQYSVF